MTPYELPRGILPYVLNDYGLTSMGVEVGVCEGIFSKHILANWPGMLLMVDAWQDLPDYGEIYDHHSTYRETLKNVHEFGRRAVILRETSLKAASTLVDGCYDFVYLDANHSYEAVKSDLWAWYPKVKKGGIFCGDDYGCFPETPVDFGHGAITFGVKKAVDEFALKIKRNISINWLADWDCAGKYVMEDGTEHHFETRARNWWMVV